MSQYDTALRPNDRFDEVSDGSQRVGTRADGFEKSASGQSRTLDQVKAAVSGKLNEFARKLESRRGESANQNSDLSGYEAQAADWMKRSANYIEDLNPQQIKDDLAAQVRRNPGKTLLIATAAGLILGSVFRRR